MVRIFIVCMVAVAGFPAFSGGGMPSGPESIGHGRAHYRSVIDLYSDQELETVPSADLAAVYFGIWLNANQPLDPGLMAKRLSGLNPEEMQ